MRESAAIAAKAPYEIQLGVARHELVEVQRQYDRHKQKRRLQLLLTSAATFNTVAARRRHLT